MFALCLGVSGAIGSDFKDIPQELRGIAQDPIRRYTYNIHVVEVTAFALRMDVSPLRSYAITTSHIT
jgi:hypothetical protein